jgi:cbb3-type cytochrome oxidase maturation protein|nr:cbb3-type cytochrome oxidase assembly protein CcoS [uncultured Undibacterium sp.]
MEILYLLVPLSVILVFAIGAIFWWALHHRQFDDLDEPGQSIIDDKDS